MTTSTLVIAQNVVIARNARRASGLSTCDPIEPARLVASSPTSATAADEAMMPPRRPVTCQPIANRTIATANFAIACDAE